MHDDSSESSDHANRPSKGIAHRCLDAVETVPYAVGTIVGVTTTTALATVTIGLGMTGIGIPFAFLFYGLTLGAAAGTTYTASKTVHKASHVFGGKGKCHSGSEALAVLTKGGFKK